MKKWLLIWCVLLWTFKSMAQGQEITQLLLNVEKLAQFKGILKNMKKGYDILYQGYNAVKNISEGSFTLHKTFLDGLLTVSPAVRNYKRVRDIIDFELRIASTVKAAMKRFREDGAFSRTEMDHMENVFGGVTKRSLQNLDELAMVLTTGQLRMSDDERLQAIDRIYHNMTDHYAFLQAFQNSTGILALQRKHDKSEIRIEKKLILQQEFSF